MGAKTIYKGVQYLVHALFGPIKMVFVQSTHHGHCNYFSNALEDNIQYTFLFFFSLPNNMTHKPKQKKTTKQMARDNKNKKTQKEQNTYRDWNPRSGPYTQKKPSRITTMRLLTRCFLFSSAHISWPNEFETAGIFSDDRVRG